MATIEEKNAFKQIYDHYGKDKVLGNNTILYNALGDILGADGKKLRNQVKMALDAGINKVYLQQLDNPTDGFDQRVMALLDDAGLSESSAANIMELYNGMVGFAGNSTNVQPLPNPQPSPKPQNETRRTSQSKQHSEVRRDPSPEPTPQSDRSNDVRWTKAVPRPKSASGKWGLAFFITIGGCAIVFGLLGEDAIPDSLALSVDLFLIISLVGMIYEIIKAPQVLSYNLDSNGKVTIFPDLGNAKDFGIAVDGVWVMMDSDRNQVELKLTPGKHEIILVNFSTKNGDPKCISWAHINI